MDSPGDQLRTSRHDLDSQFLLPRIFVHFERFKQIRENFVIDPAGLVRHVLIVGMACSVVTIGLAGVPPAVFEADSNPRTRAYRE